MPYLLLAIAFAVPPDRTFTLTYAAEVTGLPPGKAVRVWVPVPPTNAEQTAERIAEALPAKAVVGEDPEYGNRVLYLEPVADAAGVVKLSLTHKVTRKTAEPLAADKSPVERFLKPDKLVPVDGKPLKLLAGKELPAEPVAQVRALADVVFEHVKYGKDVTGWGRGDAAWVCDSRSGNCSDFHSLFISLARSRKLPAKFEIGFGLPLEKGKGEIAGYHCWAKVLAGEKWLPVDISEPSKLKLPREGYIGASPSNRVAFSVGRDITLSPKQAGEPLNFFIYPYVEVDSKPHDKVTTKVMFADE